MTVIESYKIQSSPAKSTESTNKILNDFSSDWVYVEERNYIEISC